VPDRPDLVRIVGAVPAPVVAVSEKGAYVEHGRRPYS
jgi:hypothetical protein